MNKFFQKNYTNYSLFLENVCKISNWDLNGIIKKKKKVCVNTCICFNPILNRERKITFNCVKCNLFFRKYKILKLWLYFLFIH